MNQTNNIVVLLVAYVLMLLVIGVVQWLKPGIATYQDPDPDDLDILSLVHFILTGFMLLPALLVSRVPVQLLQFNFQPNDVEVYGLLLCLLLIACWPDKQGWQNLGYVSFLSDRLRVVLYAISRITYLVFYEWFFRGLLLMECCRLFGTVNAVVINIVLYTLAHFHKPRKEIIGCIPFGLLLCIFTIVSQSIWPAIIIHLVLASKFEWRPLYHLLNPQKRPV